LRRLLIRLVAVESILVGWLSYWVFLVYANNPSVSQGLAAQLGRFPQLSFTTVDISVLVVIASLSIFLAFKFQRGLRPGIRLERALQMLENLMKRNLVLEAQVAELKLEKAHIGSAGSAPPALEERAGSWERAFRTPIEAGPSLSVPRSRSPAFGESSSDRETGLTRPGPKVESRGASRRGAMVQGRAFQAASSERPVDRFNRVMEKELERGPEKTSEPIAGSARPSWEDSPKRVSETGVLTPAPSPKGPASLIPVSDSKQPYIPVPVPKASLPPSVISGPGILSPVSAVPWESKPSLRSAVGVQASPRSLSGQTGRPTHSFGARPPGPMVPLPAGFAVPRSYPPSSPHPSESKPSDSKQEEASKEGREVETDSESKPAGRPLKKLRDEED